MQTNKLFKFFSIIVAFIFGFIFFQKLGSSALIGWDEAIYAQIAKQSHSPFVLTWLGNINLNNHQLWFEKPPLIIYLIQISYKVFGVNEFAARFWPALFALGTIVLTYFVTKEI